MSGLDCGEGWPVPKVVSPYMFLQNSKVGLTLFPVKSEDSSLGLLNQFPGPLGLGLGRYIVVGTSSIEDPG